MEKFNWEDITEKLRKAVKLEKNKEELTIKITILEPNIEDNQMVGGMLKDQESMKQSLGQFINNGKPVECEVEINNEQKYIILKFKDTSFYKKTYDLFYNMFFGDYFKEMIEAMIEAFGGFFGGDDQ